MSSGHRTIILLLWITAITTILTGCGGPRLADAPMLLEVGGLSSVEVANFAGNVEIIVEPRRTDASIELVRESTHGQGRTDEGKLALDSIECDAVYDDNQSGRGTLRIVTRTSDPEPYFLRAHLRIRVPGARGVTVRTNHGHVSLRDVQGPLHVESSHGDVRIITNWGISESVNIINDSGDIDYRVRGNSSGRIDARSIGGKVDARVRYGRFIVNEAGRDSLRATLNNGNSPIRLRTTDGDIRIAVIHNPDQVGPIIRDP